MDNLSFDDFACPECSKPFDEEDIMEVCGEPYNGAEVTCSGCDTTFNATITVSLKAL